MQGRYKGMRVVAGLVLLGLMAIRLHGQSSTLNGPILGFIPDERGTGIRPILGIPGASTMADRLQLGMAVRGVVISPKRDYALAARSEDGQAVAIDFRSDTPLISAIADSQVGPFV